MTERDGFGNTDIIGVDSMDLQCNLEFDEFNKVTNALNKLAEYEELEERCCKENSWGLKMLTEKWKEIIEDIQELYEYRKAEEQNRLLKLPCKAGQKVCLLRKDIKNVIDGEITSIRIGEFASDMKIFIIDDNRYTDISFDKIGDIVFFTREDAEAALKELERG